jgi:hypothetical protein
MENHADDLDPERLEESNGLASGDAALGSNEMLTKKAPFSAYHVSYEYYPWPWSAYSGRGRVRIPGDHGLLKFPFAFFEAWQVFQSDVFVWRWGDVRLPIRAHPLDEPVWGIPWRVACVFRRIPPPCYD